MRKIFCVAGFLLCLGIVSAQIAASAVLDSADILIGDQVGLRVFVKHHPTVDVREIDWKPPASVEGIEILKTGAIDTVQAGAEFLLSQSLTITSFDSGYYFIPPVPVIYTYNGRVDTIFTEQLGLMVRTIPVTGDSTRLEPIKPIIEEPFEFQDALPYLAGILGLIALIVAMVFYLRRFKRREAPPPPVIKRPAHEIALDKLEGLRKAGLWQQGKIKEYQSELTYIVREYLENRFHIKALESTTEEILRDLRKAAVDPQWIERLRQVFQTADLVKFANAEPPVNVHDHAMEAAEVFVFETKAPETNPPDDTGKT